MLCCEIPIQKEDLELIKDIIDNPDNVIELEAIEENKYPPELYNPQYTLELPAIKYRKKYEDDIEYFCIFSFKRSEEDDKSYLELTDMYKVWYITEDPEDGIIRPSKLTILWYLDTEDENGIIKKEPILLDPDNPPTVKGDDNMQEELDQRIAKKNS